MFYFVFGDNNQIKIIITNIEANFLAYIFIYNLLTINFLVREINIFEFDSL